LAHGARKPAAFTNLERSVFRSCGSELRFFEISHVRNIGQQLQDLPDNRRPNSIFVAEVMLGERLLKPARPGAIRIQEIDVAVARNIADFAVLALIISLPAGESGALRPPPSAGLSARSVARQ
jgi:hypothetical protein